MKTKQMIIALIFPCLKEHLQDTARQTTDSALGTSKVISTVSLGKDDINRNKETLKNVKITISISYSLDSTVRHCILVEMGGQKTKTGTDVMKHNKVHILE